MAGSALDLIGKIVGLLGALSVTALGFSKILRLLTRGKRESENHELAMIRENAKQLREENDRCWEDNRRLREEHAVECEEHEEQITRLEKRLEARIKQVHDLNNLLQFYVLEYGDKKRIDERKQERVDERQVRQDDFDATHDENGEPR